MTHHKFRASFALGSSLLLACLAGCGSANNTSPDNSAGASTSISSGAVAGSGSDQAVSAQHTDFFVKDNGDGTKVIKDVDGTEVTVPVKAERVANIWHANNQVTLALGGADTLVATTHYVTTIPWFKQIYPNISQVSTPVSENNDLNMEDLLKSRPDVVLVANEKQAEQVREAGLTAVRVGFKDLNGLMRTVDLTAEVLGTKEAYQRAQRYNTYMQGNIDKVQERLKDLPDAEKPQVLHIGSGTEITKVSGQGIVIDEWIKLAGGTNVVKDVNGMKSVSMEQITAASPQVVIVGGDTSAKGIETIKSDPAWADVPAVKDNKLYRNPYGAFNWDRYSTEEALQILWAAKTLHPDRFADIDIVKETREFYKNFYGYDLTEDEAKLILAGDPPAQH